MFTTCQCEDLHDFRYNLSLFFLQHLTLGVIPVLLFSSVFLSLISSFHHFSTFKDSSVSAAYSLTTNCNQILQFLVPLTTPLFTYFWFALSYCQIYLFAHQQIPPKVQLVFVSFSFFSKIPLHHDSSCILSVIGSTHQRITVKAVTEYTLLFFFP